MVSSGLKRGSDRLCLGDDVVVVDGADKSSAEIGDGRYSNTNSTTQSIR
jgi:hypothetical protein